MTSITPRTFKGTRDFLPEDMYVREQILSTLKSVFRKYGFAPLETPAVEFMEILAGKYGDEADKLLYPLAYKGGKELALRYDLTVPLARVVAMHPHLPKPFKRFQIQPVWRADNPQLKRGRYREFFQCDVDTVGSAEQTADAEIIALMVEAFCELGFDSAEVRLNSRKILSGIIRGVGLNSDDELDICRIVDKLDKIGGEGVRKELLEMYSSRADNVNGLCDILDQRTLGADGLTLIAKAVPENEIFGLGLKEINEVLAILEEMNISKEKVKFDFTLARGLDYYTGPIFEVILPDRPEVGSVAGGGRYDDLVGLFLKESFPAVGTSFGMERIHTLLKDRLETAHQKHFDIDVLVCYFDESTRKNSLGIVRELREAGYRSELYFRADKMKKQFSYADKKNIPLVAICGTDEIEAGIVKIKNMRTGDQESIDKSQLVDSISGLLNKLH